MKMINKTIVLGLFLSLLVVMGCKKDDPDPVGDAIIEALTTGSWSYDGSLSSITGTIGDIDMTNATISFTESGGTVTFTLGGDIANSVTGGSFDVASNGNLSNKVVNTTTYVTTTGYDLAASETTFTISLTVSGGRVSSVGTQILIFKAQ